MRICGELIGLPVIELRTGLRIAEVSGVSWGIPERRALALVVQTGKLYKARGLLKWSDIYSLGVDAVTVSDHAAIRTCGKVAPTPTDGYLYKQVLTTSGQLLGRVEDIAIEPTTGKIIGCVLTNGLFGDLFSGRTIIPLVESAILNDEHMIVPDEPWGSDNGKKS